MRILADENCDMLLVGRLRAAGHDVARVVDQASGASDEAVLELAAAQDRILLTHDLDFGLLSRSQQLPPSVVLIRLDPLTTQTRADIVAAYFSTPDAGERGVLSGLGTGRCSKTLFENIVVNGLAGQQYLPPRAHRFVDPVLHLPHARRL
jgi:predicted nuclease of predicted toxin-antitoxin system